jgi:hypothetical protein
MDRAGGWSGSSGLQRKPTQPSSSLVTSAFASLRGIPASSASPPRGSLLSGIESHVAQELRIQRSETERIGVFKEAAREACAALEHVAPFLAVIIHEYNSYISFLEVTNREIHAAKRDRDNWERKYEMAVLAGEEQARALQENTRQAIAKIEARLKGAASLSDLVERTELLERQLTDARREVSQLRAKLDAVAAIKVDFQNAVHYVEQAFQSMSHERDLELAQRQVEYNRLRKELHSLRDTSRMQLLDANAAKDAVEILLANALQREQQLALRAEGLEMRNSALITKALGRSGAVDESRRLLTPRPNHALARNRVPELGTAVDVTTTEGLLDAVLERMDDLRAKLVDVTEAGQAMEARVLETLSAQVRVRLSALENPDAAVVAASHSARVDVVMVPETETCGTSA